eukprot:TRINITY_DN113677_c0_g1_i1.p2 TRINITY_DN113677_c0_g1~~TRINITY_DN113677_c0_g1_i1.p2  ORF type:complete len:337 (-),score=94.90 TRINITY_DN113677_c0_g1_i1:325-1335(-)
MAVDKQVSVAASAVAARPLNKSVVCAEDKSNNVSRTMMPVKDDEGLIVPPMSKVMGGVGKGLLNGQPLSQGAPLKYASPQRGAPPPPYNARLPEMGPIPESTKDENLTPMTQAAAAPASSSPAAGMENMTFFNFEETLLILDWDDTVLPSTWVHMQGLRLDDASFVTDSQREQLDEVAAVAAETLRVAKQFGTVVLVTNAERGWIELSCQKFMPTLYSALDGIKVVSARTTYEGPQNPSPLDWKLRAFEDELKTFYGANLHAPSRRKNVLSLGDSVNEREALLRSTAALPNCRHKSLKFVERPEMGQLMKQHNLVTSCFQTVVHFNDHLDLVIRCN